MRSSCALRAAAVLVLGGNVAVGLQVDVTSPDSIKSVASTIAYDMMTYYKGNQSGGIPGVLPGPPPNPPWGYYWWESGAMWGTLIDYWFYTNDSTYNDLAAEAIQWQRGENDDMMPSNWSQSMGNDDQGFWGMTAMTAAETNFQAPPDGSPGWLALAQAVWNTQATRPDDYCGGGLRWQVYPYLQGYDYKNSIANGCFFNIGSRLARYTGNATYAQHIEKIWDWITTVGFIDKDYNVFDGGHIEHNCTDISGIKYSYNSAIWLLGAANMYNFTNGSSIWKERVDGLLTATLKNFFPNDIAYEYACESHLTCSADMFSFKAYLTRWMAATTKVAPFTAPQVMPVLAASAKAAAQQCCGGDTGRWCGLSWSKGAVWDGTQGVGQQMAAMSAIFTNLAPSVRPPYTNMTGGTSKGDPNAGSRSVANPAATKPATTGDRVGAGVFTTFVLLVTAGTFIWMGMDY